MEADSLEMEEAQPEALPEISLESPTVEKCATVVKNDSRDSTRCPADDLANLGLPRNILTRLQERGITQLHPWQLECLATLEVTKAEESSFAYVAPTGGGKTIVAEIMMLRRILSRGCDGLIVWAVPFKSIADEVGEKMRHLLRDYAKVRVLHSGDVRARLSSDVDVVVCTMERANVIFNAQFKDTSKRALKMLIIDEVHMLVEKPIVEKLLTKINYYNASLPCRSDAMVPIDGDSNIQVVAFSATMPNFQTLARWIEAREFVSYERVTPLNWFILTKCAARKEGNGAKGCFQLWQVHNPFSAEGAIDAEPAREYDRSPESAAAGSDDVDAVHALCKEVESQRGQVLVFCGTRKGAELMCRKLAEKREVQTGRRALHTNLCQVGDRENAMGQGTLLRGIGVHHAGLPQKEKRILEAAYRQGLISVLCATATLASGVNLPANRVVIVGLARFQYEFYSHVNLQQMGGRSGRYGASKHGTGDVVLVLTGAKPSATRRIFVDRFLSTPAPPMLSSLLHGNLKTPTEAKIDIANLEAFVLEAITLNLAFDRRALSQFVRQTFAFEQFLSISEDSEVETVASALFEAALDEALSSLQACAPALITNVKSFDTYLSESLGNAAVAASLPPEDARILHRDIEILQDSFVLQSPVHLLWLVIPVGQGPSMPASAWRNYYEEMMKEDSKFSVFGIIADGFSPYWRGKLGALGAQQNVEKSDGWSLDAMLKRLYQAIVLEDFIHRKKFGQHSRPSLKRVSASSIDMYTLVDHAFDQCNKVIIYCKETGHETLLAILKSLREDLNRVVQS